MSPGSFVSGIAFGCIATGILVQALVPAPAPRLNCEDKAGTWACHTIHVVGSTGESCPTESCMCLDGGAM